MRPLVVALVVLLAFAAGALAAFPRKSLAGPPEEFALHSIPNPRDVINLERSVTMHVTFSLVDDVYQTVLPIPVVGDGEFVFTFSSPFSKKASLSMTDPDGAKIQLKNKLKKESFPVGNGNNIPMQTYVLEKVGSGFYDLRIKLKGLSPSDVADLESSKTAHAVVTVLNNDNFVIESHLNSYDISVGKKISISAKMSLDNVNNNRGNKIKVKAANLNMKTPSGTGHVISMNDDGVNGDLFANDGLYSAEVLVEAEGDYFLQPVLAGFVDPESANEPTTDFVRSTQHLLAVSKAEISFTGNAWLTPKTQGRSIVHLGVNVKQSVRALRAHTEVWAIDRGMEVPVAWLGGLIEIENNAIALELDHTWLVRAGVTGNLFLRNTFIADIDTAFPVAINRRDMKVVGGLKVDIPRKFFSGPIPSITKEMREGVNPLAGKLSTSGKRGIVMVPGYCSAENPWSRGSADFTGAYYFDESNLNLSNDEYAQKVMAYANAQGLESFGIIGHSQGGLVALHIHNYYFTGLEAATGGRLIQTVGTPWKGSTAAGDAADLGKIFGIGCGANSDLTLDGAVNWLAGISTEARKDVYYFTTTYQKGNLFGDYCSLAMNLILQWPNDAVTELKYASLEGGNDMGNKEKWCHTVDLAYPAQYDDAVRNREMNAQAAR